MVTTKGKTGSRIALPTENVCASCGLPRGNVRKGWEPVTRAGQIAGWTCPDCPTYSEPIRREVKRDGRVRYFAQVGTRTLGGQRKQVYRRSDTLAEARAWVAEQRASAATANREGRAYADPSRFTVQQIVDRWQAGRLAPRVDAPGGIRRNTANGYASAMSSLLSLLGDRTAREVTPDDIERALSSLATVGGKRGKPLAHRSLVYALQGLRLAYAYALRAGWVLTDPASVAHAPRQYHAPGTEAADDSEAEALRRWTPQQLGTFRAYVDDHPEAGYPWQAVGYRLTLSGLRRSEVLGLDWRNVDTKTGTVRVRASRSKDGRSNTTSTNGVKTERGRRSVNAEALHPGTANALRALWLTQGRPAEGLVIVDAFGVPVQPDAYSRRFRTLCKAAGVPFLRSIHNIRHTIATALQEAGVPDNQAAALLGHDVATYRRFYLVTDDDAAAAAAEVGGRVFAV